MDEIPANPTIMESLPSLDSSDEVATVTVSQTFSSVSETFTTTVTASTDGSITATDETSIMETETSDTITATTSSDPNLSETFTSSDIVTTEPETTQVVQEDILPCETMDESQNDNDEDPSIAIDQFIKKIADEQLSGKRTVPEDNPAENDNAAEAVEVPQEKAEVNEINDSLESDLTNTPNQVEESTTSEGDKDVSESQPDSGVVSQESQPDSGVVSQEETTMIIDEQKQRSEKPAEVFKTVEEQLAALEQDDFDIKSEDEQPQESVTVAESVEKETDPDVVITSVTQAPAKKVTTIAATETAVTVSVAKKPPVVRPAKIESIPFVTVVTSQVNLSSKVNLSPLPKITQVRTVPSKVLEPKKSSEIPQVTNVPNKVVEPANASDVPKDPLLITSAQEELKKVDVLVCGVCHDVFHFYEEFKKHKAAPCNPSSSLVTQCENESKPQVWGFILWKMKQVKLASTAKNPPSSWEIYQKWCKLPQADKNAWITAGQTIQFCSKIGNAKLSENKQKVVTRQLSGDKDPLAVQFAESNKENSQDENNGPASELIKRGIIRPVKLNNDVTILPSVKVDSNSNKAIRTTKVLSTQKQEYAVEKIVAKRFNPRRKIWEYQIKWENFPSESNTWEPISNLNHCKQMLEQFEEQLRKLKEEKSKQTTIIAKGRGRPPKSPTNFRSIAPAPSGSSSSFNSGTPGRPQRSSKQKAMDQVKAWCGTMSDNEEGGHGGGGGVKRPFEDDDSDDSFEKRMKYEVDSDESETEAKPKFAVKKQAPPTPQQPKVTTHQVISLIRNGTGGTTTTTAKQILPQNVLIPDANGVVRINQKQLPSLSTGVYIMSKTAGIIKLDSTTSKVATSGGQTIVKVAPKIGQTQIKIVKKDGNLTKQIIQVSPKPSPTVTPIKPVAPKTYKPLAPKPRKPEPPKVAAVKAKQDEPPPSPEPAEDSDDGIEPLDFPSDLPLPEPESPPGEFVLDPTTGKIAGKEYPEPSPPPPQKSEPEEEPPTTNELENIVKLAAADITDDDLQSDPLELDSKMSISPQVITTTAAPKQVVTMVTTPKFVTSASPAAVRGGPTRLTPKLVKTPVMTKTETSILNKALTAGPAVFQKTMMGTPRPRVQQRIINSSMVAKPQQQQQIPMTRTMRQVPQGPIRTKIMPPKPKFNIAPQAPMNRVQRFANVSTSPQNKVQVYSTKSSTVQRRVGNTIIKSANTSPQKPQTRVVHTVYRASPKKETYMIQTTQKATPESYMVQTTQRPTPERRMVQQRPKTVISMPSLLGDEDVLMKPVKATTPIRSEKPTVLASAPLEVPVVQQVAEIPAPTAAASEVTDLSSFTLADNENPIFITGDDGTVYQVAGQNEQGQTILITQGADGQQQCLLVTNEVAEDSVAEAQPQDSVMNVEPTASVVASEPLTATTTEANVVDVKEPLQINTEPEMDDGDGSDQVVAQVVRAEPPSPGGTHKVVVMLPDGNLMVTQVSPEEYASLELD